jgi:hypothetical protein
MTTFTATRDRLPLAPEGVLRSEKIQPRHLDRLAVVYVRQSTPQQVVASNLIPPRRKPPALTL